MTRWVLALLLVGAASLRAQEQQDQKQQNPPPKQDQLKRERPQPATSGKEEVPPEEDAAVSVENFSYNPLMSHKWVDVGNQYYKKGSYRAAANRFRGATRFDESNSEAWLRLGEAEEKLKDTKAAKEAYSKYLEIASNARNAAEIRKKIEKMK
jgi:tetratricopeptide (TPR) repeat protein